MEKAAKIKKENRGDVFLFGESYDDEEGCIHIPVRMHSTKNDRPQIDIDFENSAVDEVMKKHGKIWTGQWKTVSSQDGIKEYLFYY